MSDRMRLLMLGDGCSFHVERMLAEMRRQDIEVTLTSLEYSDFVDRPLKRRGPVKSLHYTLAVSEVAALIEEIRPDVLYAHYATGYGHLAALANTKRRCPVFLNLWGSDILIVPGKSLLHRAKAVKALEAATQIFADSEYLLKAASELAGQRLNGTVLPWGIERQFLQLFDANRTTSDCVRIIIPRAHEEVYDNLFIVEALQDEINGGAIELTFPSFGSQLESFRSAVRELTGERVRFYDKLKRPEFMRFYSGFDAALSNSRSDSSPVSLIEAMALGLLVVARDIPGVREWVDDASGLLYPAGDKEALRKAILSLSESRKSFQEMREQNHERVKRTAIFEENIAVQIELMRKSL